MGLEIAPPALAAGNAVVATLRRPNAVRAAMGEDRTCWSCSSTSPVRKTPGKVIDRTLPLDRAPEGYQAMGQRTASEVLLTL
jgi:hypothetical protein